MASKKQRIRNNFNLGGEQAEADPLLEDAFFETGDFEMIESRTEGRCFIVGRTGAGKSAALQRLSELHPEHVIRINPEDLSLPYITNLHAIRWLDSLEINLDPFWTALWKHVLLVEIIRHRYKVDSPAAKTNMLTNLREWIKNDRTKAAALEYLNEFEGKFWCEADERVKEITDTFSQKVSAEAGAKLGFGPFDIGMHGGGEIGRSTEARAELVDRFQRLVNETQLARLNKMLDVMNDHVLDSDQHFTYLVIDDLDRDWVDERIANDLIRCLFSTVVNLKRVTRLRILVALRTNIFQELDFGKRGAAQEEKFRALVLPLRWTRGSLQRLLDERVRVASTSDDDSPKTIQTLLPHPNRTRGNPLEYIFDRTLLRPRDAISFVNACLQESVDKRAITWDAIQAAERSYSEGRLLALRDEWKLTYPGIDRVIGEFRGRPASMRVPEFVSILEDISLLTSDPAFPGTQWLTTATARVWTANDGDLWYETYSPLIRVLYSLGVLGFATDGSRAPKFDLDDSTLPQKYNRMSTCSAVVIHRMLHLALDVRTTQDRRGQSAPTE
ncbi:P-loop ATPase, Sll1717 family [Sinomonas atrocyanea]